MKDLETSTNLNRDKTVLVREDIFYEPIEPNNPKTPYGLKCVLINETAGVAYMGVLSRKDTFPTHYSPLPKFRK